MFGLPFTSSALIKGGPGRGKTFVLKSMMNLAFQSNAEISLVVPDAVDFSDELTIGRIHHHAATKEEIEQEIARLHEMLTDRQTMDQNSKHSPSICLFVDEAPYVLHDLSSQANVYLRDLITDGPDVNIYVSVAGQQFENSGVEHLFSSVIDTDHSIVAHVGLGMIAIGKMRMRYFNGKENAV